MRFWPAGCPGPTVCIPQVGFSQLRALSPSGRCAPFDAHADGLVVGEGAGILVLKRLEDALNDGDTLFGIIRGIGLSNDMRGNLLAPDTEGQVGPCRQPTRLPGGAPLTWTSLNVMARERRSGMPRNFQSLKLLWENTGSKSRPVPHRLRQIHDRASADRSRGLPE